MSYKDMKQQIMEIAKGCLGKGAGYSQESVVLREVVEKLGISGDERMQKMALTCWHDLFRDGDLSWGYNIDNPNAPFFHLAER